MKHDPVAPFIEIVNDESRYLAGVAASGTPVIGYFCTYTPVELIHSMGLHPARITGSTVQAERAYSLVPAFICPYMRGALEKGLRGDYRFLSGVVQGYTCDAACGLLNIWEENIGGGLYHSLPLPYNDTPDSREFFRSRLLDLAAKLEAAGGVFNTVRLNESLELFAEIRVTLQSLYDLRRRGALPVSSRDLAYIMLAGFIMSPGEYLAALKNFGTLISGPDHTGTEKTGGIPVLVSGSIIESPDLYGLIEECGGAIVADDLCTGYRGLVPAAGTGVDPVDALMDRYMKRFPCPARSRAPDRAALLTGLVRESGARGVIFMFQKFCTPHLADHPVLRKALAEQGIPSAEIEIEESAPSDGQMRTRLESFLEMIS